MAEIDSSEEHKKLSFRRFLASVWWVIKIYWKIYPIGLIAVFLMTILSEAEYIVSSYVRAWTIDRAVNIATKDLPEITMLLPLALAFLGVAVVSNLIGSVENFFSQQIRLISGPKIRILLHKKLRLLGIQNLESPQFNNLMARAQDNMYSIPQQLFALTRILGSIVGFVSSVVIIINFFPLYIPIVLIASVPMVFVDQHFLALVWDFDKRITEWRRSAYTSMGDLINSKTLHELNITGGYKYLLSKFEKYVKYYIGWQSKNRRHWLLIGGLTDLSRNLTQVFGVCVVIWRFILAEITIGMVTFYISVLQNLDKNIFRIAININDLYEGSQRIDEFKSIFDMEPAFSDGKKIIKKLKKGPEIELKNVSFAYPNSKRKIIKNLTLKIKSGEKIAVVGHNGAGKTTLVKLIARFYQASEGEILINNTNINYININSWYRNIGILFQEYNMYRHLSAKENIVIGDISAKTNKAKLRRAAKRADAYNFINEFGNKFDQILSEKYKDGTRPSTGQWQKIAIARFFYRNAPLVIFDEPTAAIDAVSEQKIFNKIYKFFKGKTVIIISHRFSTVRNADRIIVFEKGRVVEHGSHKELMALKGNYANAFNLQAKGYQ